MKAKSLTLLCMALGLVACANPGITQTGPDTYFVGGSDKAGMFGNTARLKAGIIRKANEFAASKGKVAEKISEDSTPAYPTHFATYEYQFRLVEPEMPGANR